LQLDLRTTRRRRGGEVGAMRNRSTLSSGSLERGTTMPSKTDRSKESRQQENLVRRAPLRRNESVRGRQLVLCAAAGASTLRGSGSRRRTRPFAGSEGLRLRLGTPDPTNYLAGPKPSSDDDVRQCPRTLAEHISCSLLLLEFIPMHSDSQQFVNVAFWSRASRR
jgi:hypothetical protein